MVNGFYRKAWTIPDRVFDILSHYSEGIEVEVIRAIRAYSRYWDDHRTDEGFDYGIMSDIARAVFFAVYNELYEVNKGYYDKCAVLSENALCGVVKRNEKKIKQKKQKEYYEKHREAINSKRRSKYAEKKRFTQDGNTKNGMIIQKQSDESTKSQCHQNIAGNSANAHRIIGLNNNPSLRSELLLERGIGGKPSYQQMFVDVEVNGGGDISVPTGSLSGNKAVQTGCSAPVCSKGMTADGIKACGQRAIKAVNGNEIACNKGSKRTKLSVGRINFGSGVVDYTADGGKMPPDLARMDYAESADFSGQPSSMPKCSVKSAPHPPDEGEVLITKGFRIDLKDPVFQPYHRADRFLLCGVENFLKEKKMGCSVDKKWICRQIVSFAGRQGKMEVLLGTEENND